MGYEKSTYILLREIFLSVLQTDWAGKLLPPKQRSSKWTSYLKQERKMNQLSVKWTKKANRLVFDDLLF